MDSIQQNGYEALLEQLENENRRFLDRARYRSTSNDEWFAFYARITKALEPHFVGQQWKLSAVKRFLPTLRVEVMRHLTQGFEDWPLFVLLLGRIELFIEYVLRWTSFLGAEKPEDYRYCTTTCLAMQLLYSSNWMPTWVHDDLRQLVKEARSNLETLGDEIVLASLLQQFGTTMKTLCKKVRARRCSSDRWTTHMRVIVKWLVVTGVLAPNTNTHALTQEEGRKLLTTEIKNEEDDATAFRQVLKTAADFLRNERAHEHVGNIH